MCAQQIIVILKNIKQRFSFQNDREYLTLYEINFLKKYHILISIYSIWELMNYTLAKCNLVMIVTKNSM